MMNLSPSSSRESFELLHPAVQRWIWQQGWNDLREVQSMAIPHVMAAESDVLISATTAAGKTEAAWLPIASRLAQDEEETTASLGVKAIYLSPLKALINDQSSRLESLFTAVDLPVSRRHGDIAGKERNRILSNPDGILLTTPESFEALFINHGPKLRSIFAGLRFIVIDELHAFIGRERGAQVQSLCHRVEQIISRRIPRVALSATLGDLSVAADYLRPGENEQVAKIVPASSQNSTLLLQLRGYIQDSPEAPTPDEMISRDLSQSLQGTNNLVFANSRRNVEIHTDALRSLSEAERRPTIFLAHHGNLSKEHRESVEQRLKSGELPTTAICTSTLELGIDIGSVSSVGQIGSPGLVSSLRQRVGRSGRRGHPPVLRCYISGKTPATNDHIEERLSAPLIETIAIVELMLEQWIEPPRLEGLSLSTLIQQLLSIIAQFSGRFADELFRDLCLTGPFSKVTEQQFIDLLRSLGAKEILTQAGDGLLLPGRIGERIINHYSFYTAFETAEEYRIIADGRSLGTLPISSPIIVGEYMIFAGKRWQILSVDAASKIIEVKRATGGRAPKFEGSAVSVHGEIRRRMFHILQASNDPGFLDERAQSMLGVARSNFSSLQLQRNILIQSGTDVTLIPWCGDDTLSTLALMLTNAGLKTGRSRMTIDIDSTTVQEVNKVVHTIVNHPPSASSLADHVADLRFEKHDWMLPKNLLVDSFVSRNLNVSEALKILTHVGGTDLTTI